MTGKQLVSTAAVHVQAAQPGFGRLLDWIKEHWLNAPGITAAATIGLVIAGLIPYMHWRRRSAGTQQASQRAKVLRRVRRGWISGVLEASLEGTEPMALDRVRHPELVDDRTAMAPHLDFRPPQLPAGRSVLEISEQAGGHLLILGEPGAGKTTLLLQLAKDLLDLAEHDPGQPVPVVLNLSSWAEHRGPLAGWAGRKLAASCKVSKKTADRWIEQDSVALLLDGLDEVPEHQRAACVTAVNAYLREHDLPPVAICCRISEARRLAKQDARLHMQEAVELMPATDSQVSDYLDHLETTGTAVADIRAAIAADQDLKDLLRSPLMLNAIRFGYHALTGHPKVPTAPGHWPTRLWAAYIEGIFTQYPIAPQHGYGTAKAISWLAWLARAMRERRITEFSPSQLTARWIPAEHVKPRTTSDRFLHYVASDHPLPSLSHGQTQVQRAIRRRIPAQAWLVGSMLTGLGFGALTVHLLHHNWTGKGFSGDTSAIAWILLIFLAIHALVNEEIFSAPQEAPDTKRFAIRSYGAAAGIAAGVICGFIGTITGGLYLGIAICAALWLSFETITNAADFGIFMVIDSGRPFAIRILLARTGAAPVQYKAFLDEMTRRQLLRNTGNGYFFAHYRLRDHIADNAGDTPRTPAGTPPGH